MNESIKYLSVFLNVDLSNEAQSQLLSEAIRYANESKYHEYPKSIIEEIETGIFLTKATGYFRQKLLHPLNDFVEINNIKHWMHDKVRSLSEILKNNHSPTH